MTDPPMASPLPPSRSTGWAVSRPSCEAVRRQSRCHPETRPHPLRVVRGVGPVALFARIASTLSHTRRGMSITVIISTTNPAQVASWSLEGNSAGLKCLAIRTEHATHMPARPRQAPSGCLPALRVGCHPCTYLSHSRPHLSHEGSHHRTGNAAMDDPQERLTAQRHRDPVTSPTHLHFTLPPDSPATAGAIGESVGVPSAT